MAQQISIEDALAAFRKKCSELIDANVLLEARAAGLDRRVAELEAENTRLQGDVTMPAEPYSRTEPDPTR
jgi:hypothetical protein